MPKLGRKTGPTKTQHEKFVELARELGVDESESAFVGKLRKIARVKTTDRKSEPKRRRR